MNNKILYGLGTSCGPNIIFAKNFKEIRSPSIFAGIAQCPALTKNFIPQYLFNGMLEKYFFNKKYWQKYYKSMQNKNIYISDDNMFYFYMLNGFNDAVQYGTIESLKILGINIDASKKIEKDSDTVFFNKELSLINWHPFENVHDNGNSIHPYNTEYNYKKYLYWKENKYSQLYFIILHPYVNDQQLIDFNDFLLQNNYNTRNFYFLTNRNIEIETKFNFYKIDDLVNCSDDVIRLTNEIIKK